MHFNVLYHANCSDGFCCVWVLSKVYHSSTLRLYPVQHGSPPPDVERPIIVDFCYDAETLKRLNPLIVIDHHKTAEKALRDSGVPHVYSSDFAACELVWKYFSVLGPEMPDIVRYCADRDMWRWREPDSRAYNAGLRTYPHDLNVWNDLARFSGTKKLIQEGTAILKYQQSLIDQHVKRAVPVTIDGHSGYGCECTCLDLVSEIAGELATRAKFGVTWHQKGNNYIYSLRSRGDFDVSEVARRLGGGGHRNAAGFTVSFGETRVVHQSDLPERVVRESSASSPT